MKKARKNLLLVLSLSMLSLALFSTLYFGQVNITGFAISDTYQDYVVYILNSFEGETLTFVIPVENTGENQIQNAYAEIEILDSQGQRIDFIETDSLSISPQEKIELSALWNSRDYFAGRYQARITLFLDEESFAFSKIFQIERKEVTFESILVRNFRLGETVEFDILVRNHLWQDLENVSAGILLLDNSGNIISEIRSERITLETGSTQPISVSWNTQGIESGDYNAKLILNYGENFIERDLVLNIQENSLDVVGIGYSIANNPQEGRSQVFIMMFLIILLILVNLVWIVVYNRKKKKK